MRLLVCIRRASGSVIASKHTLFSFLFDVCAMVQCYLSAYQRLLHKYIILCVGQLHASEYWES